MPALWQALDWCAHHNLWTPAFLEFFGGRGGGAHDATCTSTSFGLPGLSFASPWPGWLPGWLARWLVAGWLLGWLARWLVAAWLALCLTGQLAGG